MDQPVNQLVETAMTVVHVYKPGELARIGEAVIVSTMLLAQPTARAADVVLDTLRHQEDAEFVEAVLAHVAAHRAAARWV